MVEVTDRAGLEKWLEGKPREVLLAIASRAALRVFPYVISFVFKNNTQTSDLTVDIYRAFLIASVAPVLPTEAIKRIASEADNKIRDYDARRASRDARSTGDERAIAANCACAAVESALYPAYINGADGGSIYMAASAADYAAVAAAAIWQEVSKDLTDFERGVDLEELTQQSLWQDENPLLDTWHAKQRLLHDQSIDWSFWIDWYQRILDGRPQNWEMLEEIALIDPEDWDKGAEHVNGMIAEIQARYAVKETVEAAQKVLAEYPVASAQMGHNNPPEDIEDDPFTAEDAAFVQKMLDDIGEECENGEPDVSRLRVASDGLGKVIRKIGVWLAGKLDIAADAFFKELGGSAAKYAVRGGFLILLIQVLQPVIEVVGTWLPFIGG